ncbi:hypothetical protein BCR36DRAFT_583373 [Piromyces finnis]|uniref:PH domain-containing protein n=1 Tax=Piromyces finnis TaxID=1754191 RepID=A0A1Y1VA66_9FUNG|nr:hypothetical protein BCR36DRAFT_583373 [Piromyces finnis]|eukprot:ORX50792.1 hypothetical protein BCR36DRAFT_583373 [Piromyces finnis]
MKLFKRNQSVKKQDENYNKILNESELEPYPYTPTLDADDMSLSAKESLLSSGDIESRYVNSNFNNSQSFTGMSGKEDNGSTIKKRDSFFNEIQQREVNNKNTSFVIRGSQFYGDECSSIHGEIGVYDDAESVTDIGTTVTNSSKATTQYSKTVREEMSEATSNYQNSSENNYTNLQTQSIYATPIFSGFLYKLGRNKRWQWRMFCFDGMSLACLSSKCKPKYVIPLDKIESIKLLHRNAPEYKPNTFVITVEKNDCKGEMDEGFFPYSEASISNDPLRPKRTFSIGYYSYLLRAKTSVDLERWMFVLLTMYGVMKKEKMMNSTSFSISTAPPQPMFSFTSNSYDNSFQSRNDHSYSRQRINSYDSANNSEMISSNSDSLRQIKIPSLSFAPPLSTMITSQYKDRVGSLNTHVSTSTPTTPISSNNNSAKNSNSKLNFSSPGTKDGKVEIVSAQRYRDPNYNPVNYTSDLSNLRLESRRNNKQAYRNPYISSKENNNNINVRSVNSLTSNNIVASPTNIGSGNVAPSPNQPRKASLNSPKSNRISPRGSPKVNRSNNRVGRESVIVSSIMQDFIFNDFDKDVEIDDSLKEYAVQSLRLFSLAEQKAIVENVHQAWKLGKEEDEEILDVLVEELKRTTVTVENKHESVVSQIAQIEIMDDDDDDDDNDDQNKNPPDNTFISFAVDMNIDENENDSKIYRNRSTGHINKRNGSNNSISENITKQDSYQGNNRKSMDYRNSAYVQKAWRNSIASLLNLDSEMNVSLGLSNFCPTLSRNNGELRSSNSQYSNIYPSDHLSRSRENSLNNYNKNLGRGESNAIKPRIVNNTKLSTFNSLNRGKAIYLGDVEDESDSDDSESEDDEIDRPVRKDSMNPRNQKKNRMSYIPKGRPFSYYLSKKRTK